MYLIQILLIVFALFALLKIVQRFRANDMGGWGLFGWVLFWLAVIVVAVLPDTAAMLAKVAGVGRGADLIVYLSLALLFYLVFRFNVRLEKMKREITTLTRELSLKDEKNKN